MPPWNDFKKAVRDLKRQGCNRDQAIELLMTQYPEDCRNAEEVLKQIQAADKDNFDDDEWSE